MKIAEVIRHLAYFQQQYGDIDVYVDADIWKDTTPKGLTTIQAIEFLRTPQFFIDGHFPSENVLHRVVMYVGNESSIVIGPSKLV